MSASKLDIVICINFSARKCSCATAAKTAALEHVSGTGAGTSRNGSGAVSGVTERGVSGEGNFDRSRFAPMLWIKPTRIFFGEALTALTRTWSIFQRATSGGEVDHRRIMLRESLTGRRIDGARRCLYCMAGRTYKATTINLSSFRICVIITMEHAGNSFASADRTICHSLHAIVKGPRCAFRFRTAAFEFGFIFVFGRWILGLKFSLSG